MKYSIDTNACIDAWREYYPYEVFPRVWEDWMVKLYKGGELGISRSVFDELEVGGDDLFAWVKANAGEAIREDTESVQQQVADIQANWPNKDTDFQRRLKGADLFVIGHAIVEKSVVVSHEQKSGSVRDPKIPDACQQLEVDCIQIAEMFKREGFSF